MPVEPSNKALKLTKPALVRSGRRLCSLTPVSADPRSMEPTSSRGCPTSVLSTRRSLVALFVLCAGACSGGEERLPEPYIPIRICSPPKVILGTRPIGLPDWTGGRLTVSVQVGANGKLLRAWLPDASEAQASEMRDRLGFAFEFTEFAPAQDCQGRPVEGVLTETWVAESLKPQNNKMQRTSHG